MRKFVLAFWTGSAIFCFAAASDQSVLLWYRQPAEKWVEAMPIGNGRLGAMVFGKIADEHIQLNEDTVWSGERRDRMNPAARQAVPEIRRLLFAGKVAEAEAMADKDMLAIPRRTGRARRRYPRRRGDPAVEGFAGAQSRRQVPRRASRHSRRRQGACREGRRVCRWSQCRRSAARGRYRFPSSRPRRCLPRRS